MNQFKKHMCLFLFSLFFSFASMAQNGLQQMGLIHRLIEIKYTSELYLTVYGKKEATKDSALAIYNVMRWQIDGFIFQLCSDMIATGGSRNITALNKWYIAGMPDQIEKRSNFKKIRQYTIQLHKIESDYNKYIHPLNEGYKNINLTTNVFYLIKDSWSVLKGLSDMKTQKVMALVEILDQTRLMSPFDLIKQTK